MHWSDTVFTKRYSTAADIIIYLWQHVPEMPSTVKLQGIYLCVITLMGASVLFFFNPMRSKGRFRCGKLSIIPWIQNKNPMVSLFVSPMWKYCLTSLSSSLFSIIMSLTGKEPGELSENRNKNNVMDKTCNELWCWLLVRPTNDPFTRCIRLFIDITHKFYVLSKYYM